MDDKRDRSSNLRAARGVYASERAIAGQAAGPAIASGEGAATPCNSQDLEPNGRDSLYSALQAGLAYKSRGDTGFTSEPRGDRLLDAICGTAKTASELDGKRDELDILCDSRPVSASPRPIGGDRAPIGSDHLARLARLGCARPRATLARLAYRADVYAIDRAIALAERGGVEHPESYLVQAVKEGWTHSEDRSVAMLCKRMRHSYRQLVEQGVELHIAGDIRHANSFEIRLGEDRHYFTRKNVGEGVEGILAKWTSQGVLKGIIP